MAIGTFLLAAWLIVTGLQSLVKFSFPNSAKVLGVVAIAAGVLILLGR
jgi:hypothetical protein